jgi:uncharacterized protein YihD (DUF1040 family)
MPWDRPRDPARIAPVLDAVQDAWTKNPELRLGQLIVNAARRADTDAFQIEDDRLIGSLGDLAGPPR